MECQECKQRPATLHFTKIINGEKTEVHLCEQCSQEKSEMFMNNSGVNFSINNLLAGLLNLDNAFASPKNHTLSGISELHCSHCKLSYSQFTRLGMFGCSNCYESFSKQLEPILRRLHNGNAVHTGKVPKRIGSHISVQRKVQDLKSQMQACIQQEEFEKAAEIRDELRLLERKAQSPESGGVSG
mgnify:CR=1 FL=1